MRRMLSFLLLLTLACSGAQSSQRPQGMPQPEIDARLTNSPFFGSTRSAPATIEVTVRNRGQAPLVVHRIEIDSPGMSQYYIQRYARIYNETVEPGQEKALTAFTTAIANTTVRPTEPLTVRALVELQSQGKSWREVALFRQSF